MEKIEEFRSSWSSCDGRIDEVTNKLNETIDAVNKLIEVHPAAGNPDDSMELILHDKRWIIK